MVALLDRSRLEIKLGDYGTASATVLSDPTLLPRVQEYRRLASARMQPLDRTDIKEKIPAAEYHVSRKVDGEFTVLVFREGQVFSMNPGGTVRVGLPWMDEAAKLLSKAGLKEAMIAGELYVNRTDRRPRVHDVSNIARQPQSAGDLQSLNFAVFDVMSIDGAIVNQPFANTWKSIQKWFGEGQRIRPVEAKSLKDAREIEQLFEEWVDKQDAEGLVVRSDLGGMFKVKPRHTLDVAVIGFTESVAERQGMMHDLLLAVMRTDGTLQLLGRVGGGFSEDQRRGFLSDLKDMVVESEYAEVNSDHVAYQMVDPQWVIEISCLDLISQTTRGAPVNRMVLDYHKNGSAAYHVVTKLPLATIISPQFVRRREDKQVRPQDVRIAQVTDIVEVALADRDARQMTLPKSELLHREVYTKDLKGQTMVRKFLMWKTNKEAAGDEFPAYVVHYTDFSPNRKDALARDVRVSSSPDQIQQLFVALKEENIKAGWQLRGGLMLPAEVAAEVAAAPVSPVAAEAKPAKKKAAAKKADAAAAPAAPEVAASEPAPTESPMAPSERVKKPRKKKSG
jgi:hypothetical protein